MNTEEEIFQPAAALPAGERAAFLDAACDGQAELRARIEALLVSHDLSGFMDAAVTGKWGQRANVDS